MPADLVGTRIYNQKPGEVRDRLGPVFTNLLLADEINRAPAKVQSARRRFVNTGHVPNSPDFWLKILVPTRSAGTVR